MVVIDYAEEKRKKIQEEKAERHQIITRRISLGGLAASVLFPLIIAGITSNTAAKASLASAAIGYSASSTSMCLSWATFVTEHQRQLQADGVADAEADSTIDRIGVVVNGRISVWNEYLAEQVALAGSDAKPTSSPAPGQPASETSLANLCGTSQEYRRAGDLGRPLELAILPLH